ncbi:MAG: serine/threonine-protein kinase [Sandaracinaceae bacterium]
MEPLPVMYSSERPPAPPEFPSGSSIGSYVIDELIGVGGMADVYLAHHVSLHKKVAVKILQSHSRGRSDLRARFLREGQAASRIHNANVVEIFDVGTQDDVPYLVMKYLPGPTLAEHLAEHGTLNKEEAAKIFLPICAAVAAGHEQGVIHRDLKPENVILVPDGGRFRPTVLDFGVSRLVTSDPALTIDSSVIGTPHYMSPEQARGERIDTRTDQYALGVMLYEAATGRLPRDRPSVLELLNDVGHKGFDPPTLHQPTVHPMLEAVILKMMADDRKQRFATTLDAAAALLPLADDRTCGLWMDTLGVNPVVLPTPDDDAPELVLDDADDHAEDGADETAGDTDAKPTLVSTPPPAIRPTPVEPTPAPALSQAEASEGSSSSRAGLLVGLLALLLLLGGAAFWWSQQAAPAPAAEADSPEGYAVHIEATPAIAQIFVDDELLGTGELVTRLDLDGQTHELRVEAPGFETRRVSFRDSAPPPNIALQASEPSPAAAPEPPPSREGEPAAEAAVSTEAAPARPGVRRPRRPLVRRPPAATAPSPTPTEAPAPADPPAPAATPTPARRGWEPDPPSTDNVNPWDR